MTKLNDGCNYYVLNTNDKFNASTTMQMLEEEKAAAYHMPWQSKIVDIKKGDVVFLYLSGTGIIAYGIGTGAYGHADYDGDTDAETFTPLREFKVLNTAMKASKMKELCQRELGLINTLIKLRSGEGEKILEVIEIRY